MNALNASGHENIVVPFEKGRAEALPGRLFAHQASHNVEAFDCQIHANQQRTNSSDCGDDGGRVRGQSRQVRSCSES